MASKEKKAKHGIKHTHIEHHHDGSHTVKHTMHDGSEKGHALADDNALVEHMQSALATPAPAPAAAAGPGEAAPGMPAAV